MTNGAFRVPTPINEPVREYTRGSSDRDALVRALEALASERVELPTIAGSERLASGKKVDVVMPHDHGHVIGHTYESSRDEVRRAVDAARAARRAWSEMPFVERAAIFLRAAERIAGPDRMRVNAACMLGQGKTCHQAEIDAACELIDFLRFNVHFAERIYEEQPLSVPGQWNRSELRPLEGFVYAVTPFNFLAIAVNLPVAPALMGNVVVWKPAHQSAVGCAIVLDILRECGLPDGVITVVPGAGPEQSAVVLECEDLAGVHFTGSTATFRTLWKAVGERVDRYHTYPRLVGETGGKDFIVAHPSADARAVATAILRGGYEYQGQKCSAASRVYLPRSLAAEVHELVAAGIGEMKVGDVRDFSCFVGAVIDRRAFDRIDGYLKLAKDTARVVRGGKGDARRGYFIEPTFVEVDDPKHRLMQEEIFGPVVTAWTYDDAKFEDALRTVDSTSPYALTGAIFARDRAAVVTASRLLRDAAGNFYVNDKPTGAVVGQQPFGGARASGTNDKAGSLWNLVRWTSPRSIKETLVPATDWRYPYLG